MRTLQHASVALEYLEELVEELYNRKSLFLSELTELFHKSLLPKNRGGKKGMQGIPTYIIYNVQAQDDMKMCHCFLVMFRAMIIS